MRTLIFATVVVSLCVPALAQTGPDIIVGSLPDLVNYTPQGGYHAYSAATTSCNIGTQNANWIANSNDHPIIAQQLYRVRDGVFEQVGRSWLKHGFVALTGNLCGSCNGQGGSVLGVGCSDPYSAGRNGSQSSLGPRAEVNPFTGIFAWPHGSASGSGSTYARLRVSSSKVTNQPAGTRFFIEGQYVAKDDAATGNHFNNASWRECTVSSSGTLSLTGTTIQQEAGVFAWQASDPQVQIQTLNIPNEGRFYVGFNSLPIGGGFSKYIFTLSNLNSDLAASGFSVAVPAGANIQNQTFNDDDYHSGEVWQSNDWNASSGGGSVSWASPHAFATTPNGAALRWASTHTFTFESNMTPGQVTVTLFKNSATHTVPGFTVPTPDWQVNQSAASMDINGISNNPFVGPIQAVLNYGTNATWNFGSSVTTPGAGYEVYYHLGNGVPGSGAGYELPDGQIVNLDTGNPNLAPLFGGLFLTPPPASASFTFTVPNTPIDMVAQMAVLDATAPLGVWVSAAMELDAVACTSNSVTHSLGDDASINVAIGPGTDHDCIASLTYYGMNYNSFHINSNGSVSFAQGSTDFTANVNQFRNEMPRVAGHWSDIDPSSGGTIRSVSSTNGSLAVSFVNTPQFGSSNTVSFDVVFSTNGDVTIGNHTVGAWTEDTLIGFSPGGGAGASAVNFAALVGSTTSYSSANAIYQYQNNGGVSGFTNAILHSNYQMTVN